MPVYLSPGVYIEEIPSGARPIEGVSTSTAAFVGPANRGPAGEAVLIGKLDDYKTTYGDIVSETDAMGLAVHAFYLNGGKAAYVCRLAGGGAAAADAEIQGEGTGGTPTTDPVLVISASSVGSWGNDLYVVVEKPDPDAAAFTLKVGHQEDGRFVADETLANLSMREGDEAYVLTAVGNQSNLIDVTLGPAAAIGGAGAQYDDATIRGGDTGGAADYFSTGLGGSTAQTLSIAVNGRVFELIPVDLSGATIGGTDHDDDGEAIADAVEEAIRAHSPIDAFQNVSVDYAGGRFTVTSAETGSLASLEIGGGPLVALMRLGPADRARLTGGELGAGEDLFNDPAGGLPSLTDTTLTLTIDGHGPATVTLDPAALPLAGSNAGDGAVVAAALQTLVRSAPDTRQIASFREFTCSYTADRQFVLTSGAASPRTSGMTAAGGLATFLELNAAPAVAGREVNQGVAPVIPQQTLGAGGAGRQLTGGVSVAPSASDYADFYQNVLRKRRDVSIIVLPGSSMTQTSGPAPEIAQTLAHAESMQDRMVLVDPPPALELADASVVETMMPPTSTYAVMYYPWVEMANPLYNPDTNPTAPKTVFVQPSAFAAGIWAKTDARRGVWKAPAGVETRLIGASALRFEVEDVEQAQLNPLGVNCYRKVPSFGPVVWGTRTLSTRANPEWRYVPVRRTAIFIEQSIYNGIQWAVFEPNDHPLWSSLRANIGAFMNGIFRAGGFQGRTADEAYFVRCNLGDTMTQADIDRGQVIVIVGFAPLKPAELVIVRIQQKVAQQ
jgi:phage tail sheath protein FI